MFQTNVAGITGKGREEHRTPVELLTERQRGDLSSAVNEVPCRKTGSSRVHKQDQGAAVLGFSPLGDLQ